MYYAGVYYVRMYVYMYVRMYVYMYACVCVSVHVSVCVCIHRAPGVTCTRQRQTFFARRFPMRYSHFYDPISFQISNQINLTI